MRESLWSGRRVTFGAGFLSSFLLLFALIAAQAYNRDRDFADQRATGLASVGEAGVGWDSSSLWRQPQLVDYVLPQHRTVGRGVAGGVAGGVIAMQLPTATAETTAAPRKITRNAALSLGVADPARAVQQVGQMAEQMGGYVTESESNLEVTGTASVVVLLPAERLDEALSKLKALAASVEGEKVTASDVTRAYADLEAALVNARAEEAQYRELMKRARTLDEIMNVTHQLSQIRAQIDQKEGDFRRMRQQVEMSRVDVALRVESETQIGGFHWRPIYRVKMALHDGVDSLAMWLATMVIFLFQLPVVVLWLVTIVVFAAFGWKLLRWVWCRVFVARTV
jgi:hypothetical protein